MDRAGERWGPAFYLPLVKPCKIGKVFNKVW
jgi:hypothetical protein